MKERKKPHIILAYEALLRRLKENYRSNATINADYQRFSAGFRGERNVDYKLKILPHKEYLLYYGLRLKNYAAFFQIDTLVITENFICIVEIKNLKGKLIYDSELEQLTQVVDGQEIGYKDPILQAEAQKENLKMWLRNHGIPEIPIETLVVLANPSTIITNIHNTPAFNDKFIHAESLPFQLTKLKSEYTKKWLDKRALKKLNTLLLKGDMPLQSNLFGKYGVSDRHIIKGVPCPNCQHYPMDRLFKKWSCSKCSYTGFMEHERVILDFFLLYQHTITNSECRKMLHMSSRRSAYTFLNSMKIDREGNTSARKYYAPHPDDFPQNSNIPVKKRSVLESGDVSFFQS